MSERDDSEKSIAVREGIPIGERGLQLRTMDDAYRFAQAILRSGLAPTTLNTAEKIMVAVQTGMEAGLTPIAAMRSVYVVNGMPAWRGENAMALVRGSGRMEHYREGIDGADDNRVAWVRSTRDGVSYETRFSVADAKVAKLWGKVGRNGEPTPWVTYPERMLLWRARGFHCKDYYSDVLLGIPMDKEAEDYPEPLQLVEKVEPPAPGPDPLMAGVVEAEVLRPGAAAEPPEDWTPTEVHADETAQG